MPHVSSPLYALFLRDAQYLRYCNRRRSHDHAVAAIGIADPSSTELPVSQMMPESGAQPISPTLQRARHQNI